MSIPINPFASTTVYRNSTLTPMDDQANLHLHSPDTPSKPPTPTRSDNLELASTLSIPSLNLPVPLLSSQPLNKDENANKNDREEEIPARAKAKKIGVSIIPLPQTDESWAWGQGSLAPNSLKDLKPLSSLSLGGSLTVRPNHFPGMGFTPRHEGHSVNGGGSVGTENTVKPLHLNVNFGEDEGGGDGNSSYTRTLRQFERDQKHLDQADSDRRHEQEVDRGDTPSPIVSGGIDEVQVEWCFYCKTERERTEMELIRVALPDGSGYGYAGPGEAIARKKRKVDTDDQVEIEIADGDGGWQDYAGEHTRHRAEHASRAAAAAAHASYYAHPSLHLHTYISKSGPEAEAVAINQDGQIVGALNEPYTSEGGAPEKERDVSSLPRVNADDKKGRKTGNEGTKEEEGGKEDAGQPSGLDRGAMEKGGEAGGTRTSPGPSAQQVQEYLQTQGDWHSWNAKQQQQPNGAARAHNGEDGLQVPARPGMEKHSSVSERMNPHLQLMCGPLLAYYTVKDDIWQGAAMIVVRDEGSILQPLPSLTLTFHPYMSPSSSVTPSHESSNGGYPTMTIPAQKIHTYTSKEGSMSFFRFIIEVPLQHSETAVNYRLNGGAGIEFVVPAKGQNLRWAAHSCNGFSSGVNPDEFKGKYASGYDPVWEDMLLKHHQQPFHCMVGGGDQIYCDAITREPELQGWINAPNRKEKIGTPLTEEIKHAVDRFYFNHYCKIFRSNAFGRANSTIPMVNMLDDHDLIDGFGTYDDETQAAPVMSYVGSRGYFWFLLFQLFVVDAFDGTNPNPGTHMVKSMIVGSAHGPWIPFPTHSLLVYLGSKVALLALDCRAERKLDRICTRDTYEKAFGEVKKIGPGLEQLVILLGVPIAYPRMSFLEHFLDLKWNPINMLARHNAFGLGGMVNKFNQASELLDDLNDHWCANTHKPERNWLVLTCQELAKSLHVRITFLSGDVHLAAVGCLFTYKKKESDRLKPEEDHRYMLNVITSAIVNTPPPPGAAKMVGMLGGNKHRTLPKDTDECMIPLFDKDTDGSNLKHKLVQPRRNYAIVEYKATEAGGELEFEYRVEKSQGAGETVSYAVRAPAPRYKV